MTVRDLIDLLSQQNPEHEVFASPDRQLRVIDIGYEGTGPTVFLVIEYPRLYQEYLQERE